MTPPPHACAVWARGLRKHFGPFEALRGLDLTVEKGAFYAFLGPNGAGKSTTLALVTGLYAPDGGDIDILGQPLAKNPIALRHLIGIVPEELALFERLTGMQYLTFCGRMFGLPGAIATARADELLALTELLSAAHTLVGAYSKGMRRRIAIAAALIHQPQIVFLDEPFEGIDVMAAGVIKALLSELSRQGVTLVLTTHVLEIAERLATHAGIVVAGKMVDEGPVAVLKQRHGCASLEEVFGRLVHPPASKRARLSFYA
ncbi:MAG: ABC transporter ATP-binding protein [Myxococcaceae bacterium]